MSFLSEFADIKSITITYSNRFEVISFDKLNNLSEDDKVRIVKIWDVDSTRDIAIITEIFNISMGDVQEITIEGF